MRTKKVFKNIFVVACIATVTATLAVCIYVGVVIHSLNSEVRFNSDMLLEINARTLIYDKDNKPLTPTSASGNPRINFGELPEHVKHAFIAIEDKDFYRHKGLSIKRILAAGLKNFSSGYSKEGASTISQQLIKNTHLTSEKTFDRKIKEAYLTLKLENRFTKDEILETYLNAIYFGNSAYGLEQATKVFFSKPASKLTIAESATLAGVIKSPRIYSPIYNQENCLKRRNLVLQQMQRAGYINDSEYQNAKETRLSIDLDEDAVLAANQAYLRASIDETARVLNLSERDIAAGRFRIYTHLSNDQQTQVAKAQNIANNDCVIVLLNEDGNICALAGDNHLDLANLKRPGGSIVKPFLVYAPALEVGLISPATAILDEPVNYAGYSPRNINGKYSGWTTIRKSLANSTNIPAIKTLEYVGVDKAKAFASKLGLEFDPDDTHLALALGGMKYGVNPIAVAGAYASFSHSGTYKQPSIVRRVENSFGQVVYEAKEQGRKVFGSDTAYLVTDMLRDSVESGTAKRLKDLEIDIASKTGTAGTATDDTNTDAWNVSYTTKHTLCVWIGNSSGNSAKNLKSNENGGTTATSIAKQVLGGIYNNKKPPKFSKPESVVELELNRIDLENQRIRLASPHTLDRYKTKELFSKRFAPVEISNTLSEIASPILNGKATAGGATLSFKADTNLEYNLFLVGENEDKIVKTFKNKTGDVNFDYSEVATSDELSFYLVARYEDDKTSHITESAKSNVVKLKAEHYESETQTNPPYSPIKQITNRWFG